jgi:hypothetical protein
MHRQRDSIAKHLTSRCRHPSRRLTVLPLSARHKQNTFDSNPQSSRPQDHVSYNYLESPDPCHVERENHDALFLSAVHVRADLHIRFTLLHHMFLASDWKHISRLRNMLLKVLAGPRRSTCFSLEYLVSSEHVES